MVIRPANTESDVTVIKAFKERLTAAMSKVASPLVSIDTKLDSRFSLEDLTARNKFFYVACYDSEEPVGFIELEFAHYPKQRVLYVCNIYVLDEYRGKGCGTALLNKAKAIAADMGCTQLQLTVLDGNANAMRFYIDNGLIPIKHRMACKVI